MMCDSPDPVEVTDFHFHQLRTLRLVNGKENVSDAAVSTVAAASKYGLIFVGIVGGIKVLKFEDVMHLDENKENRSIVENFNSTVVVCPTPIILSLNESQRILAVCSLSESGSTFSFYDVAMFESQGNQWKPSIGASPKSAAIVQDFIWNPANDDLFAYCMGDGSLHIEMLSGGTVKHGASLATALATSACWSPKGKQLVVGRSDGGFTQYKPSLQEVKTIPPPELEGSSITVSSICWISNTQFAVVYVVDNSPYVFMVSTPKDSPVTYTNYYDVCLGNNSSPNQKYFLRLEPLWGILICGSADSIEIAVLGNMPNWVQWDLKEDGKALMPGKDGASHPIGISVLYSAQKPIVISDTESYPPMPVIFFMTDNGLLVSFHMINCKADAVSLVYPPLIQEARKDEEAVLPAVEHERVILKRSSSSAQPTATFASTVSPMNSTFSVETNQQPQPTIFTVTQPGAASSFKHPNIQSESISTPSTQIKVTPVKSNEKRNLDASENGEASPNLSRPWETATVKPSSISDTRKKSDVLSSMDNSYMTAVLSEMQSFSKELQELKLLQSSIPRMDNLEEMATLKIFAMNLQNFQEEIADIMQSLITQSHTLKNVLLESFMTVEEASSRDRRKNDHSYITLLKERTLNPVTAKNMARINQHYHYLNSQLHEVNNKLDQDWSNFLSSKKKNRNNAISSTEAIYKTFVNNQKIIHNLRKRVDELTQRAEEKKMKTISKSSSNSWRTSYRSSKTEDLSQLADEFLQMKFTSQEEHDRPPTRKLPFESQNRLRDFLKNSMVVTVRPTAVYSPPQSRLLSNMSFSEGPSVGLQEKDKTAQKVGEPVQLAVAQPVSSDVSFTKPSTISSNSLDNSRIEAFASSSQKTVLAEKVTAMDTSDIEKIGIKITSTPIVHVKPREVISQESSLMPLVSSSDAVVGNIAQNLFKVNAQTTDSTKKSEASFLSSSHSVADSVPKTLGIAANEVSTTKPSVFSVSLKTQAGSSKELKVPDIPTQVNIASNLNRTTSVANVSTSVSTQSTAKNLFTSESSAFKSQEPTKLSFPLTNFTFGALPTTTSTPATTKVTTIFPTFTVPENKSVFNLQSSENKSLPKFSFQSPVATGTDFSSLSTAKKTEPFVSLASSLIESSGASSSADKILVVDTKTTSIPQVFNIKTSEETAFNDASVRQIRVTPLAKVSDLSVKSTILTEKVPAVSAINSNSSASNLTIQSPLSVPISSIPAVPQVSVEGTGDTKTITISFSGSASNNTNAASQVAVTSPNTATSIFTSTNTPGFGQATTVATSTPILTTTTTDNVSVSLGSSSVSVADYTSPPTPPTTVDTPVLFGKLTETPASPAFKQTAATDASSQPAVAPAFGQTAATDTSSPPAVAPAFGQTAATDTSSQPAATPAVSIFGATATTQSFVQSAASPVFGQTIQPATTQSASVFGQTATTQSFGQPVSSSGFGQAPSAGGFFTQTPTFGAGATTAISSASTSPFSFGKSAFGTAQTTGSFGLANSIFGQQTTSTFTQPTSPQSSFFGQASTNNNTSSVFGTGGFFTGLGGAPSAENANKNVFGLSNTFGQKTASDSNSIFGNTTPVFGAKTGTFGSGSFSSGGGSVAQSGFGSFQQTTPQKTGFGFGSQPTFGSAPAFGSPPSFGSGNALSSVFGQQQQQPQANFSNFASASSPTFGSLASQTPTFGSTSPGFGSFGQQSPPSQFGQSSGFGSTSSPTSNSSAFTQWRN